MQSAAHGLGVAIVASIALALVVAGMLVATTAPLFTVGHLLVGPLLIVAGGAIGARLVFIQMRAARRAER
jgi:hypothetical protein